MRQGPDNSSQTAAGSGWHDKYVWCLSALSRHTFVVTVLGCVWSFSQSGYAQVLKNRQRGIQFGITPYHRELCPHALHKKKTHFATSLSSQIPINEWRNILKADTSMQGHSGALKAWWWFREMLCLTTLSTTLIQWINVSHPTVPETCRLEYTLYVK